MNLLFFINLLKGILEKKYVTYSNMLGSTPSFCIFNLTAGTGTPNCNILKNFLNLGSSQALTPSSEFDTVFGCSGSELLLLDVFISGRSNLLSLVAGVSLV